MVEPLKDLEVEEACLGLRQSDLPVALEMDSAVQMDLLEKECL
tara:strand:+ start:248 stop:376 length:129 start_codon:yes stop_codon:yes gene_type:complete